MEKWRRPALCRLCRFPAGADGVPVSRLDAGKLSRWWREALRTERNDDSTNAAEEFFCQFCLWDAKLLMSDPEANNENCDWWLDEDTNKFYKRFHFAEQIIRQCAVSIAPLPDSGCAGQSQAKTWDRGGIATHCQFCEEVFKSRSTAFQHMKLEHESRSTINCNKCHLVFLSSEEKIRHTKMFHCILKCHICCKGIREGQIQKHIVDAHACTMEAKICCGKQFSNLNQLADHFLSERPSMHRECIYCRKKLATAQSIRFHMNRYHASKAIKCNYFACVTYFSSKAEKEKHVNDVHESKSDLVECLYCDVKTRRILLPRHVNTWHKSISYSCSFTLCLSYFHSEREKTEHELKVHLATKVAPGIDCIYCDKKLDWKADLYQHVMKKHKNVAIRCKSRGCGMYFLTDEDRDTHAIKKHAEEEAKRKWKCGTCGFRTNSKKNLNKHESRHKPENIKCPQCPKLFSAKRTLQKHIHSKHPKATFCIHCKSEVHVRMWHHLRVRPCERCKLVTPCMGVKKTHMETCTEKWPRSRT